jgi:hypothetical protein
MKIHEVSSADYHTLLKCNRADIFAPESYLSKSVLWELNSSSLFKWRFHPREFSPTPAMQWGSLVDCLTTTPELVEEEIRISPFLSYRTKEAKEWRDEQLAVGKTIITQQQFDEGVKASEMLMQTNVQSAEIFDNSLKQVIIGAKISGVQFKGLVDLAPVGKDYLVDLKTTGMDFTLEGFSKAIANFGYHVQAGLYLALWNSTHPEDTRQRFKIVWQSSQPPYEVCVTELHRDEIAAGLKTALRLLGKLKHAAQEDHWPMLAENETPILNRPVWAAMQDEDE